MSIFFTSDTHFGHYNIIRYCKRPYKSAQEMDIDLVERWNAKVGPSDIVYHLGDFSFGNVAHYRSLLNGKIHLILGNHDREPIELYKEVFDDVSIYKRLNIKGQKIILFHYPIASWDCKSHGSWHLYGHVHEKPVNCLSDALALNVGVDMLNFAPISLEELQKTFKSK